MQAKIPVLAVTDPNTDIGKVIVDGGFGWWCESNDSESFSNDIRRICKLDLDCMKEKEFEYLEKYYSVENAYHVILESIMEGR